MSLLQQSVRSLYEQALEVVSGTRGVTRRLNGLPVRVLPHYRASFANYDPPVADFLRSRVKSGDVCFNVGANVGVYALQLARWSAPTGRVYAFEPNPATAAILRRHVALNELEDRVSVIQEAVAAAPGRATFHAAGVDGMSRLGRPNPLLAGRTTAIEVPVTTVDGFCAAGGVSPDWMVIDVEGFEIAVLEGARSLLQREHGRVGVVVEMHPDAWEVAGTGRAEFERLLDDLQLRVVPLMGQVDPLSEYGSISLEPR